MALIIDTRRWYDIMVEEEQTNETKYLRMSPAEWKEEGKRIIHNWNGDLRYCLNYLNEMDVKRAAVPVVAEPVLRLPKTEFELDFAIWRDMIENPAKYGDDIVEWLELDAKLASGSGRWRLSAFWCQKEEEAEYRKTQAEQKRKHIAATVIAAAVRGHQTRSKQTFRECCMCLSHRVCTLKTDVGMMCRGCANQGPYDDETGPLTDEWSEFRADYVDIACQPEPEVCKCSWCMAPLEDGQTDNFCDHDCKYDYMKDLYRGRD